MAPGDFEQVCSQCGYCVEACPASAIRLDPHGLAGDGFPYILPADQPCVVCDSLACMKSCPSGALKLVDRLAIHLGSATVNSATCLREAGENCTLCIDVCPLAAEDHTASGALAALFINDQTGRIRVRKNICIGCGLCESRCPTDPPAITIIPAKPDHDILIA
jgi:ferredoxin-type protein NapG